MGDTAASRIRASVDALPEKVRQPWEATTRTVWTRDQYRVVCDVLGRPGESRATAAHIVLLASPDVATALADLLDAQHALDALDEAPEDLMDIVAEWATRRGHVRARLAALEAAISKGADRGE